MGEKVYRIHPNGEKKLYPTQKIQLELADFMDAICRKYQISYTLLFSTLAGAVRQKGYLNNTFAFEVGMLYQDFLQFQQVFVDENEKGSFYLIDGTTFKQFEEMKLILKKRGEVQLPQERKDDEIYYDCGIEIFPIFYAGETIKEYCEFRKKAEEYIDLVEVREYKPKKICLDNKLKNAGYWRKRKRNLRKKMPQSFEQLKEHLLKYKDTPTRYVYFCKKRKQHACVRELETYQQLDELSFEGRKFLAVKQCREWLGCFYGRKEMEIIEKKEFSLFSAYGMETLRQVQMVELELLQEVDRICRKNGIRYYLAFGTLLGAVRHGGFIPWDDDADIVMLWQDYCKFCKIAEQELDSNLFSLRTPDTDKNCNLSFATLRRNGTLKTKVSRENSNTNNGICIDIFPLFPGNKLRVLELIRERIFRILKTVLWSHLGIKDQNRKWKQIFYGWIAKIPNQKVYRLLLKIASHGGKKGESLLFPFVLGLHYPHCYGITNAASYGKPVELLFEGHYFWAPEKYENVLLTTYGGDCIQMLPPYWQRKVPHFAEVLKLAENKKQGGCFMNNIRKIEDLMDLEEGTLDESKKLNEIEEWDSISRLSFQILLEEEFGIQITGKELRELETVKDLITMMA